MQGLRGHRRYWIHSESDEKMCIQNRLPFLHSFMMVLAAVWRTQAGAGSKLNCDAVVQVGGHCARDIDRSRAPGEVVLWLCFEGRSDEISSWIGCG